MNTAKHTAGMSQDLLTRWDIVIEDYRVLVALMREYTHALGEHLSRGELESAEEMRELVRPIEAELSRRRYGGTHSGYEPGKSAATPRGTTVVPRENTPTLSTAKDVSPEDDDFEVEN